MLQHLQREICRIVFRTDNGLSATQESRDKGHSTLASFGGSSTSTCRGRQRPALNKPVLQLQSETGSKLGKTCFSESCRELSHHTHCGPHASKTRREAAPPERDHPHGCWLLAALVATNIRQLDGNRDCRQLTSSTCLHKTGMRMTTMFLLQNFGDFVRVSGQRLSPDVWFWALLAAFPCTDSQICVKFCTQSFRILLCWLVKINIRLTRSTVL